MMRDPLFMFLHLFSTYLKDPWFELGIHTGIQKSNRQCGLVYVGVRYKTHDMAKLSSQYKLYVVHECKL